MRRRIELYIDGRRADIDDASFVVFNWRREDTDNPAVIRNSWSNSVTLPGTPDNDVIFSHAFRCDRRYNFTPDSFDPSARTPFAIYQETGEILVSGYCKLDSVARSGATHSYKVTLFGGLGSLLYSLAYDASGNKRTLASLDFLGGGASELDFPITAAKVKEAWDRLQGDTTKPAMWDVINFAPCYNGIPDGDFQADKALVRPADLGWPDSVTQGGKTYTTQGGVAVATLPDKMDEWQVKDLRAYLQRPVLSLLEFLHAIAKPENNGGWTLDVSRAEAPWLYPDRIWITLPMLPKEGAIRQASVLSASRTGSGWHTTTTTDEYTITGVQVGDNVRLRVSASPVLRIPAAASAGQAVLSPIGNAGHGHIENIVTFYQLVGYDGNGNKVAASRTLADYERPVEISQMVSLVGYTPDPLNTEYYEDHTAYLYKRVGATDDYKRTLPIVLDITGAEMERVELVVKCYYERDMSSHYGGTAPYIFLWKPYEGDTYNPTGLSFDDVVLSASAEGGALRSGMLVTKQMLLGGEHTPADYLVAIIKALNLKLVVNDRDKTAALMQSGDYYLRNERPLDFSDRVDVGQEMELVPLNYDAKWYDFALPLAEGAFGLEYRNAYGTPYGIQRVNTGYDFDAGAKDVFGGPALRSCVPVSKFAQQMCDAEDGAGNYVPAPFVAPGGTYTLTASDGSTLDVNITPGAPTAWLNTDYPGYDKPTAGRPEFCKADGGTIEGQDCLVFYDSNAMMPNFVLTDDDALMPAVAGGLCWQIGPQTLGPLKVPTFSPVRTFNGSTISVALYMGQPRELALPGVSDYQSPLYEYQWSKLMADRLNVDTKVVRVKADLSGLQVGPDLLRRFVWWEGCIWSINAITNYSLSTYDPAEVELVQVKDIYNYI